MTIISIKDKLNIIAKFDGYNSVDLVRKLNNNNDYSDNISLLLGVFKKLPNSELKIETNDFGNFSITLNKQFLKTTDITYTLFNMIFNELQNIR